MLRRRRRRRRRRARTARPSRSPTRPRWTAPGGADGTGNEVRGGGVYVAGADTVASLRNLCHRVFAPEENGKGGGVNVDGGASLTVDGLLVADCVSFFAGGVFVGTGCAPAIAKRPSCATTRRRTAPVSAPSRTRGDPDRILRVRERRGGVGRRRARVHAVHADTDGRYRFVRKRGAARRRRACLRRLDARRRRRRADRTERGVRLGRRAFLNAGADATFEGENTAVENNVARDIDGGRGIAVLAGASAVFTNGAALRRPRAERRAGGGATCAGARRQPACLLGSCSARLSENFAVTPGGGVLASRGAWSRLNPAPVRICRFSIFSIRRLLRERRPGGRGAGEPPRRVRRRRRRLEPTATPKPTPPKPTPPAPALSATPAAPTALRAARCAFQNNSAPDGAPSSSRRAMR